MSRYADYPELPDLETIQAAERRIRDLVIETPTLHAIDLGEYLGQPLWLKAENLQVGGSFKARGALNWLLTATAEELEPGLVTVSAGNHALALAWAAAQKQVPVTVVMPEGSSPMKIRNTRTLGAKVIVEGNIQHAVKLCHELHESCGFTLVHPYDNPRIMAGQGTIALELLRQLPETERILCPVGGGGLISGIGIAARTLRPEIQLIGVEPKGAATMRNAWDRNDFRASLDHVDTIAVSLAPVVVGEYTYAASRRFVDDIVVVGEESIREAARLAMSHAHIYAETGAVVGIAALLEEAVPRNEATSTVAVITGGNMDFEQLKNIL